MTKLATIEEILNEARNGRMFILVDDEDRENEGDLVIPAQMATPDVINFMAMHGRGLICLSLTRVRCEQLQLPLMATHNRSRHQTAFTVSIEAKDGVSTGISAPDRARTIAVAIDSNKGAEDIHSPGHVFPLVARDGGVLVRAGHTEAAVDVARLAGLNPSGVICEIMKEDGTMARLPDLIPFAKKHGLKIATIADLIAYRLRHDRLVKRTHSGSFHSRYGGEFTMITYRSEMEAVEHVALVKGEVKANQPTLVRMHALRILRDVLGDDRHGGGHELEAAMRIVGKEGGVIVLLRDPSREIISEQLKAYEVQAKPVAGTMDLREYGIGAQILMDLGVQEMTLLTNAKPQVIALEGYGLHIASTRPIPEA